MASTAEERIGEIFARFAWESHDHVGRECEPWYGLPEAAAHARYSSRV